MAAQGAPAEAMALWLEARPQVPKVFTGNGPIVKLFMALQTQWQVTAMVGVIGLNYAAVPATAEMLGIKMRPELFHGLRIMEAEWLKTK